MSEKERKDLRDYLEKYTGYDLADEFNTQVYMIDTQEFKDLVLLYYFRQKDEIDQLEEVINEVRKYIESDPLVMVSDYEYYVNDLIQMEKSSIRMSFIGTLLQILDKVKNG